MGAQSLQSCPTLGNPMDYSLPGSSIHGFSRQGLSCPPPGDLPDPAIEPTTPESHALQEDSLPLSHRGSPILDTKMET